MVAMAAGRHFQSQVLSDVWSVRGGGGGMQEDLCLLKTRSLTTPFSQAQHLSHAGLLQVFPDRQIANAQITVEDLMPGLTTLPCKCQIAMASDVIPNLMPKAW